MTADSIPPLLEACVESLSQAVRAEEKGASRLELCSNLNLEGLTPSLELIHSVLTETKIPTRIMIRPRAGDFVYSGSEIDQMLKQIEMIKKLKVDGFVFGVLTEKGMPDITKMEKLISASRPFSCVFHKAIDHCQDPLEALRDLIEIGVNGILTSGGAKTAEQGIPMLRKMLAIAPNEIIVAGKVTQLNLDSLHRQLNATQYHGRNVV